MLVYQRVYGIILTNIFGLSQSFREYDEYPLLNQPVFYGAAQGFEHCSNMLIIVIPPENPPNFRFF